jgi:iron complex outermembrane receptor protein
MVLGEAVTMTTVSSYNTYDRFIGVDLDFSPNVLFEFETTDSGWQATQDLSFSGYISEDYPLKWDIGGFFLAEELDVFVNLFQVPRTARFLVKYRDYQQSLLSAAGYVSLAWDFWEDFTLDGGFRYNWEQKSMDYELTRGTDVPPIAVLVDTDERIWQAPTGTARLTYRFREDTHAYFKYTRGWKGGHFNATGSGNDPNLLIEAAEPEQIDAFEAGFRGSWFGGRLGASFSTFYYDYENYQIFTARQLSGSPPEFVVINASAAEVYGAELDLVARPLPGLYLQARLAWLESQFLDFVQINQSNDGLPITNEIQNTGNPLLNSPKYKVSLTAEQTVPLGRFGTLTARWDGAWTDATNYDATNSRGTPNSYGVQFLPENTIGQEAFWIHNVRLAYRTPSGTLEIAGWVRNIEDIANKTFAFDGSNFPRTTIYFVGEPRTYGVSVTTTF